MPQLSPLNWIFLFIMFWTTMLINSSIMWWNKNNTYSINKNTKSLINITYKW
uniref:ATP synthase F0 subunit 8 n=1 Tax=Sepiadarium kochi TaxID=243080 RepID=A0A8F5H5Q6_9MOLL|nr:ATP synthase F0 subunit 8 [Sepiadarium kochi]